MSNYTDALPPLSDEEFAALRDAIKREGVRVPILVDEHGNLIDGFHRKKIADELGVGCPTKVCPGLTEAQKLALAISTNTNRRQLTRDAVVELRNRWRAALPDHVAANLHSCDRAIAAELGVSQPTVGRARRKLEAAATDTRFSSPSPEPSKRVGLDGKARRAPDKPVWTRTRMRELAEEVEEDRAVVDMLIHRGVLDRDDELAFRQRVEEHRRISERLNDLSKAAPAAKPEPPAPANTASPTITVAEDADLSLTVLLARAEAALAEMAPWAEILEAGGPDAQKAHDEIVRLLRRVNRLCRLMELRAAFLLAEAADELDAPPGAGSVALSAVEPAARA